jgi:hypothetical protein
MSKPLFVAIATGMALGAVTACHGSVSIGSPVPPSAASPKPQPSSVSAAPSDYTNLLIKATDIPTSGEQFTALAAVRNPFGKTGIEGRFTNASGSRQIGDTILIQPDPAEAATALTSLKRNINANMKVTSTPQQAAVGLDGMLYPGATPDGSQAVTTLLFAEGRADVILEFHSAPDDPVPPDAAIELGQKQDAALKQGLPG